MNALDSWAGAIVRGRDGRKGRVLDEVRHRFPRLHLLMIHWDDDTYATADSFAVTMLRPPLGFQGVVPPVRVTRREVMERTAPLWAGIVGAVAVVVCVGLIVWAALAGAL